MGRFVEPGQTLTAKVRVQGREDNRTRLSFRCEVDGERACIADVDYAPAPEDCGS
jgi:hypothetical protein